MIKIEVFTLDPTLRSNFVADNGVIPGSGCSISTEKRQQKAAFGVGEVLMLALNFGTSVSAGVAARWLYDKLNGKAVSVSIEKVEVPLSEEALRSALETHLKSRASEAV